MRTGRILNDLRIKTFTIHDDHPASGMIKGGKRLRFIHGISTRKYYDSSNPHYRIAAYNMDELVSFTELAIRFYNFKEHTNFGQVKVLKGRKSRKDLPPDVPQQTLSDASVNDVAPYISQYALAMYNVFTLNVKKEPLHDISSVRVVKAMKHDAPSRKVVKGKKHDAEVVGFRLTTVSNEVSYYHSSPIVTLILSVCWRLEIGIFYSIYKADERYQIFYKFAGFSGKKYPILTRFVFE
ncbi:hypothetical protein POM88_052688 [Heracleum sosnowskyi]|uniref:Uncharacterized protein n=1 Tax=Heracleum sosnowskyi TaxID=360622 RepID=A0AAD8GPX5_9APIA|nr:hypothetical protein POM88_052688 [Heracleum sosnowskyi]